MIFVFFSIVVQITYALPCTGNLGQVAVYMSLIEKTMQVDDADRRTEEQYASESNMTLEEVQAKFGASGSIVCRNTTGSGQLTVKNNIATTSAHLFFDPKTCNVVNEPSDCQLELGRGKQKQILQIDKVIADGFNCPPATQDADDWAVVKLKTSAVGVKPYRLPFNSRYPVGSDQSLILAATGALDFAPQGPSTRSIANCLSKHTKSFAGSISLFSTNCDAGAGFSGGAYLVDGVDGPELVGIVVGGNETLQQEKAAVRKGKVNKGPYEINTWGTYGVPVANSFYEALHDLEIENGSN